MARPKQHPGYIERHGTGYRVSLCIRGTRHRFTVHAESKAEAAEWATAKHKELTRQTDRLREGFPAPVTMTALFDKFETDYLPGVAAGTANAYRDVLKVVRPYFREQLGDPQVDQVRKGHIAGYLTWRRGHRLRGHKPVSGRTLEKDRTVLHTIFAFAEEHEYREGNPVAATKRPAVVAREPVLLSEAEYELLLTMCTDPMAQLYVLAVGEGGFRNESEALWLRWEDLDLDDGFIHIASGRDGHDTKRHKSRHVPVSARLAAALEEHRARYRHAEYHGERSPWVFHHRDSSGRQVAGQRITSLRRAVRSAANRAGIRREWRMYDLRHAYVTGLLADGHNLALVAKVAGHANTRTTAIYTHLVKDDVRDVKPGPKAVATQA